MLRLLKTFAPVWAFVALGMFSPSGQAALKCQELVANRSCANNADQSVQYAPGQFASIPAPVIPGYPLPCWSWTRQFQCVETTPTLTCDSGADFNTVKNSCNLTAAAINATVTIHSISYITDATYTYKCAFGSFSATQPPLPTNKECVALNSTTTVTGTAPAAAVGAAPSTGSGTPPTTAALNTTIVTSQQLTTNYACYSPPQTTCSDTCYENVVDPATGTMSQQAVACTAPISNCVLSSSQCTGSVTTDASGNTVVNESIGPDGRCVSSETSQMCQNGAIPKCLTKENCALKSTAPSDIQDNGVAMTQTQNYVCSNTTKSCGQLATVSNCFHANAWGWDQLTFQNPVGLGLGEVNQAMAKADAIQKGMNSHDPYIFSGQDRRCHYAVGNFLNTFIAIAIAAAVIISSGGAAAIGMAGTVTTGAVGSTAGAAAVLQGAAVGAMNAGLISASTAATISINANLIVGAVSVASSAASDAATSKAFGNNCCKDFVIEGSDAWYKLGACSADEVKLAVARRKGLYHYLGEYCSKKSGFPIRQCVEKTQSYCVFDDMLALVVNEQGRAQLEAIAQADTASTTSSAPVSFNLYGPSLTNPTHYAGMNNGKWVLRTTESHSQIWAWRWPGYCRSQAEQQAAFDLYNADVQAVLNQQGIQPNAMTKAQALTLLANTVSIPEFQNCPETPGIMAVMTCSALGDTCDVTKLPTGPSEATVEDLSGSTVVDVDVNWRIHQQQTFYLPGDYGVTATMPSDPTFAAVSASVNEFVTAIGSCHTNGNCLYRFAVIDKQATGGLGARKRAKDYAQFPLYTLTHSASWPTISYLAPNGTLDMTAYQTDPARGLGTPLTLSTQRFLFHPNDAASAPVGNIHSAVLLDWAYAPVPDGADARDAYSPLVVPTSLPLATAGWSPHGNVSNTGAHFYLSGGCDANSRWCNYAIEVDLNIPLHPWGSPDSPHCWGFTLDQMAALDFDQMDLSKWIDSLDLSSVTNGLSAEAATAMTDKVTQSAQSFYSSFQSGGSTNKPGAGTVALVTNTSVLPMLSSTEDSSYSLHIALPANWPSWYDNQPNNNPVTNVWVDWGDGKAKQTVSMSSTGRAFDGVHDYGGAPAGNYKVTVTLDTANNGPQTLTTNIHITPNTGDAPQAAKLDFNNPGIDGKVPGNYVPSMAPNGISQAPANLDQLSPGTAGLFGLQGNQVTP